MTYRRASICAASIAAAEAANATGCGMEVRLPNGLVIAAFPATHRQRPVDAAHASPRIEGEVHLAPDGLEAWNEAG